MFLEIEWKEFVLIGSTDSWWQRLFHAELTETAKKKKYLIGWMRECWKSTMSPFLRVNKAVMGQASNTVMAVL